MNNTVEDFARGLCKSHGTAQCAAICLQHSSTFTTNGQCPEAKYVWRVKATEAFVASQRNICASSEHP